MRVVSNLLGIKRKVGTEMVNFVARVIIGFKLDIVEDYKIVDKFNPDTGEPIQVKDYYKKAECQGKTIIPVFDYDDEFEDLDIFSVGYGGFFLGREIAKADEYEDYDVVNEAIPMRILAFASEYDLEVRTFLLLEGT